MASQEILRKLRGPAAIHRGTLQEAQRPEDRRHLHAHQARIDGVRDNEGKKKRTKAAWAAFWQEAYVVVQETSCLDLCLFGVRIPTKGVLRSALSLI
jgi:hypothetical protein